MYRDDPLADEEELRAILGDEAVDAILASTVRDQAMEHAVEVLRVLQGWVSDDEVARWFLTPQRRLDGASPVAALVAGAGDDVQEAARRWASARM